MKSKSHCVITFFFFLKSQACLPTPKNKKFKMHLFFFESVELPSQTPEPPISSYWNCFWLLCRYFFTLAETDFACIQTAVIFISSCFFLFFLLYVELILHICVVRARTDFLCHCQGVWKPPTFFSPPFVQSTDTETGIQSGVFTGPLTRSVTPWESVHRELQL